MAGAVPFPGSSVGSSGRSWGGRGLSMVDGTEAFGQKFGTKPGEERDFELVLVKKEG